MAHYQKEDFRGDFFAGVIVAIMLVPQGMAYAMLAGLPPVIGLYASTIPLIVYAFFGSSRHLAVGPVAMISLLVYAGCSRLSTPGSGEYLSLVIMICLIVGALQVLLGIFRMGFLINYISHAAIRGFTSAAALVIFSSQLAHIFGVKIPGGSHSIFHTVWELIRNLGETNLLTLLIGGLGIFILLLLAKKFPHFPAPLLVVVIGTLGVFVFKLDKAGVGIVGNVPSGLPSLGFPKTDISTLKTLMPVSLTILFVGFMESIAVAEMIASREKYKLNSNRELLGLGLANLCCGFFSGYPVTGGFSRTAVNHRAGAKTPLASIITGILVILTLLFLTSLFYYLPRAILSAIIIVAVLGLFNLKEGVRLFRIKKTDGVTFFITFAITLAFGVEKGIITGVLFSLMLFIWRSAHPHTAELGYLEKEGIFRNIKRYPQAKTFPGVLILRVDASMYFANMAFIEDCIRDKIEEYSKLKHIVFDMEGVNDMDAEAVSILEELMEQYKSRGIRFIFASVKGPVRDVIKKAGWKEKYGDIERLSLKHALESQGENSPPPKMST